MFHVPSTPDSRRGIDSIDNPSTTPAGPPPTDYTRQSSTPTAKPSMNSLFGSSVAPDNGARTTKSPFSFSAFVNDSPARGPSTQALGTKSFAVPSSSSPQGPGKMNGAERQKTGSSADPFRDLPARAAFSFTNGNENDLDFDAEPRGAKRSRNGDLMAASMRSSRYAGPQRDPTMPEAVDRLVASMRAPDALREGDARVLELELTLEEMDRIVQSGEGYDAGHVLRESVKRIQQDLMEGAKTDSVPASMGLVDQSAYAKALYTSSLLLQIHHPTLIARADTAGKARSSSALVEKDATVPIPRALLEWLRTYHNPFPEDLQEVKAARPSPTAHDRFWDTIFQTLLRGNFEAVISLLANANWAHADTAVEDGYDSPGYRGQQLSAVQHVIGQCVQALKTCPALTSDEWDIAGSDWSLFRQRCHRALDELSQFAESDSVDREYGDVNVFAASGKSFAAGSRRAESRVPWTIYEQLKAVYGQLLGYREEILLSAQDWLEATIYLAVWWDGEDEVQLGASRRTLAARQRDRLIDVDPVAAYKRRLLDAFASVTDEPEDAVLGVNTVDATQVALGAVFESEIESVLKLLLKWSPLVAAVVAEVACVGGWLPEDTGNQKLMNGFDQDDLMVLSHGQKVQPDQISRDSILVKFADLLAKKDVFTSADGQDSFDGWDLAVRVLSRLDNSSTAQTKIASLFTTIPLSTPEQVDKALDVCHDLGLTEQIRSISARYADKVATTTHSHGQALLYYARAHSTTQLKSTLDNLLTQSLIRSSVYPPPSAIDPQLSDLLSNKTGLLTRLSKADLSAARLLADNSSGYATLHHFYTLRDSSSSATDIFPTSRLPDLARALLALISSASSPLRDGLHDPTNAGVVPPSALLALLAESLPLLARDPPAFTAHELTGTLLAAVEDLLAAPASVFADAEKVFHAALAAAGGDPQLPASMAKGSSEKFALVDSAGSLRSVTTDGDGDANMAESNQARQWDWRAAVLLTAGKGARAEDVLRLLRVGVGREVARLWARDASGS